MKDLLDLTCWLSPLLAFWWHWFWHVYFMDDREGEEDGIDG